MTTERRESLVTLPENSFLVTEEMARCLVSAASAVPQGEVLEITDLLLSIAKGQGSGALILKSVGYGRYEDFLALLENAQEKRPRSVSASGNFNLKEGTVSYAHSVAKVCQRAREIAGGAPFGTSDLVLAEAGLTDSLLVKALSKAGVPGPVAKDIETTFTLVETKEPGSREIGNTALALPVQPASRVDQPQEVDFLPRSRIVNLIEEAREGKFKDLVLRPEWVNELLGSIDSQPLTVLVCDTPGAEIIILGLADQLAKDGAKTFPFSGLIMVDPAALVTNPVGSIETAISAARDGILYLPQIQRYLKPGTLESLSIRKAMATGQTRVVTVVSETQWKTLRNEDIFQEVRPIFPEPPTIEEAERIILSKKKELEGRLRRGSLKIEITPEAIKAACQLGHRYCHDLPLPASALTILARAGTEVMISASSMEAIRDQRVKPDAKVDPDDIAIAVEKMTGIVVTVEDPERLLNMEKSLGQRIINQDEAIKLVADTIRKASAGLSDPHRPLGSFMFMGPSGVGKTELAKALAEFLFENEREMVVLDMSEYGEKQNVARLIGSPPGYVAYEEGGQLTEAVKKKPYSIVVLDEIDKAHPEVLNVLLQILEEGRLTDGQGKTIDFTQTVVIMTGNVGSKYFMAEEEVGREKVVAAVDEEIREVFRPEFLNRIDKSVIFNTLKPEHLLPIVDIQMKIVNQRLAERQISLALSEEVKKYLAEKGYDPVYGARPLRREIDKLSSQLAIEILARKYSSGDKIRAELIEGNIVFNKIEKPAGQ